MVSAGDAPSEASRLAQVQLLTSPKCTRTDILCVEMHQSVFFLLFSLLALYSMPFVIVIQAVISDGTVIASK